MIFNDSRYATGNLKRVINGKNTRPDLAVYRVFPSSIARFYLYEWTERDRVDYVAAKTLGSSNMWWKIMDYNPEIINPFAIPVGTMVRIPIA